MAIFKVKQNHDASNDIIMVFLFLFVIFFSSCDSNSIFKKTEQISKILESPSKYHNKVVTIKGKVTESILAFGVGYFVLSDETTSIAVIPSKTFPKVGEEVQIKVTVKNAFVIGDKSLIVVLEDEKK